MMCIHNDTGNEYQTTTSDYVDWDNENWSWKRCVQYIENEYQDQTKELA